MHFLVALNCLNSAKVLFHAQTRLNRVHQRKETENEIRTSEQANQKARQMALETSEFLGDAKSKRISSLCEKSFLEKI